MYKYLFGPVPSRRLGMSLGVDLVPRKVCSLDCVYCEVGETTKLTTNRKEYIKIDKVISELDDYFENNPDPDFFTFSGSGEPTLNSGIGRIIEHIKLKKPNIPIALLTNGTLLSDESLRKEILDIDLVLPSLDAASQEVFDRINRPSEDLTINDYIKGLISFRREFKGRMWLEVFILPDYNDSEQELKRLSEAINKINPDSVQLNSLDRPGAIEDIRTASEEELLRAKNILGFENIEIIAPALKRKQSKSYRNDAESVIYETISRRPCTSQDISNITGMHINEVNKYLDVLELTGKIELSKQKRGNFYKPATKK